jgi:hypothetical protein
LLFQSFKLLGHLVDLHCQPHLLVCFVLDLLVHGLLQQCGLPLILRL